MCILLSWLFCRMLYEMKRKTCDDVVIDKVHLQADDEFYISSKPKKVKLSQSVKKTDACSNEETKRRKSGKSVSKKQKPAEPLNVHIHIISYCFLGRF